MVSLVMTVVALSTSGGLLSERTPVAGLLVGAVDLGVPARSYETMTMAELQRERTSLLDSIPSAGLGIVLTSVGAGVFVVGFAIFWVVSIVVGIIFMVAALPLLIIGPILLAGASRERREVQAQVRLIDQRMAAMKREEFPPPPFDNNPSEVPPPPPMRPPGSELDSTIEPQLLLATF